jgi:FKBP-type peptidyl-prolyl cis-trans isomerase
MKCAFYFLPLCLFFITGCDKDDDQAEIDEQLIQEYIQTNNLTTMSTSSGLHYIIEEAGNNQHPNLSHEITIKYTGWLLDGTEFDSSNGSSLTFPLAALIKGWQEGIPIFGKGGNGTLIIPSALAYGSSPRASIPANSVLVFDIELVDFQ